LKTEKKTTEKTRYRTAEKDGNSGEKTDGNTRYRTAENVGNSKGKNAANYGEKTADDAGKKIARDVVQTAEKFAATDEKNYYEDIVKDVFSDFLKRREERKNFELQWRLNMNFFMGNQFSEITPDGDIGEGGRLYHWQEREVFNHIAPIIETRLARLSNVKPNVNVRPATGSDDDINTAKFAARIVSSVFSKTEIESVINEGTTWADICGACFYKIGWNTEKGALAGKRPDGSYIYEGEVEITACPPFEIYPDNLNACGMKGLKSLIHAKAYTVAQIKEIWGEDVEPADVNAFSADNALSAGGLGYTASIRKIAFEKKEDSAYVVERYTAPSREFPDGLLSIVAGDKLLYHGALPYLNNFSENVFPFIRQTSIDQAGFFFGVSVIERLIPVQRAYNAVRNRKHEFLNRIAMGVLAVEDGSVDTDNLENEGLSPGKILVYRQGSAPPHMLDMSRVPGDFNYEEEKLTREFVVISGISEITRYSKVPSNVTSGIALSLLIEQDETRLNITARNIKSAIKNIGICIVGLYKMFANERRLKGLAKESDAALLESFNLGKISCDDIVIEGDNDMMDTPANRRGMVVDLLKLGLLADENGSLSDRTRVKALEILGLGNWENSKDLDELHLKKAAKENKTLAESYIAADKIDDHKLHIDEHIKIAVGIFGDEEKKKRFERHIEEHKAFLREEREQDGGFSPNGNGRIYTNNTETDLGNVFFDE
jgi:hypothetical protein